MSTTIGLPSMEAVELRQCARHLDIVTKHYVRIMLELRTRAPSIWIQVGTNVGAQRKHGFSPIGFSEFHPDLRQQPLELLP